MKKKNPYSIIRIPKFAIALLFIFLVLIALFIYDKNLFPVADATLKNGNYKYKGEGNGEIIVTENSLLCFHDFDLNSVLRGLYYINHDLNSVFVDKEVKFFMDNRASGCTLIHRLEDDLTLEIEFYPRDDKLVLLKPMTEETFVFQLETE